MKMNCYAIPSSVDWDVRADAQETIFDWDCADLRQDLLNLYQKGKDRQWDSTGESTEPPGRFRQSARAK
jgi:hypothetical protein